MMTVVVSSSGQSNMGDMKPETGQIVSLGHLHKSYCLLACG